jgi:hypothetical protein
MIWKGHVASRDLAEKPEGEKSAWKIEAEGGITLKLTGREV